MTTPDHDAIHRVLVIKWSAMGDLAMAGAPFEDIALAFPGRRIDLDTLPPWDTLYRADPRFDHVHCFDLRRGGLREGWRWLRAIGAVGYDLVIDLQTTDRSRLMLGLLGLARRAIPYRAGNKRAWPYNLAPSTHRIEPRHALDIARDTLAAAGVGTRTDYPRLHIDAPTRAGAHALLDAHGLRGAGYAVFLPGCQAAGYLKRWGAAHYAELATALSGRTGKPVVLLGGPDEMAECEAIRALAGPGVVNLCGRTTLLQVPVICADAAVVVANDTGTAHLASAANRPMVVVCGPTDPRRVLPAGPRVRAAQVALPCMNCYRKHCAHHSCMRLLTPALVLARIAEVAPGYIGSP